METTFRTGEYTDIIDSFDQKGNIIDYNTAWNAAHIEQAFREVDDIEGGMERAETYIEHAIGGNAIFVTLDGETISKMQQDLTYARLVNMSATNQSEIEVRKYRSYKKKLENHDSRYTSLDHKIADADHKLKELQAQKSQRARMFF